MNRHDEVRSLRAEGYTNRQIAARLGLSYGWVAHCASPKAYHGTLAASRRHKRERTGKCEDCGGITRYNGARGNNGTSPLCHTCSNRRKAHAQRGTGHGERVLAFLAANGPQKKAAIANAVGLDGNNTGQVLYRLIDYGLVGRVRWGVYQEKQPS